MGIFSLFFSFLVRKIPFAGIELTAQRVRGLRGTSELAGRPADQLILYTNDIVALSYEETGWKMGHWGMEHADIFTRAPGFPMGMLLLASRYYHYWYALSFVIYLQYSLTNPAM